MFDFGALLQQKQERQADQTLQDSSSVWFLAHFYIPPYSYKYEGSRLLADITIDLKANWTDITIDILADSSNKKLYKSRLQDPCI